MAHFYNGEIPLKAGQNNLTPKDRRANIKTFNDTVKNTWLKNHEDANGRPGQMVIQSQPVTQTTFVPGQPVTFVPGQPVTQTTFVPGQPVTFVPGQPVTIVQNQPVAFVPGQPVTIVQNQPVTFVPEQPVTIVQSQPVARTTFGSPFANFH